MTETVCQITNQLLEDNNSVTALTAHAEQVAYHDKLPINHNRRLEIAVHHFTQAAGTLLATCKRCPVYLSHEDNEGPIVCEPKIDVQVRSNGRGATLVPTLHREVINLDQVTGGV